MISSFLHKKGKAGRVIPGFELTMGISITMMSLLVLIPLASILVYSLQLDGDDFLKLITNDGIRNSFITSISCSLIAALINCVFGLILAWVLVRYDFTGKKLLNGLIELPFALPTAVAGITLSKLYASTGWVLPLHRLAWPLHIPRLD